jgi:hypothetical protein
MIESDLGRTDRAEVGRSGREAWRTPEPEHGDVRKPRAPLGLVDAEACETPREVVREERRAPPVVLEHEHADAPRLAIAGGGEHGLLRLASGGAHLAGDRSDVVGWAPAAEHEGDVEVLAADDPRVANAGERLPLPGGEALDGVVGERESEEETEALTGAHVSPRRRARP